MSWILESMRERFVKVSFKKLRHDKSICAHTRSIFEQNMRLNIMHGVFYVAALDMVNPFVSIYAMRLGATKLQVALLSSAPAVISLLAMIPGAILIDHYDRKKRLTYLFMLGHRLFFLAIACIPFFAPSSRALILVLLIALMNLPGAISNVAWQSFISRIIPPEQRAQAFAARNRIMNIIGTSVTLAAGLLLDRMAFPLGYQIIFIIAFLVALVELHIFNRINEDACAFCSPDLPVNGSSVPERGKGKQISSLFREILAEKRFIRYTLASMVFYFAWQIAWPLFNWYQVKVLGANNVWVSILSLMNTGGALLGYGFWVKVTHRHGNLKTLYYATIGMFIVPAVYAFSHSLYTVAAFNLIIGAVFSGVNLALFNALLEVTPENRKTSYIAYYTTAITVSSIIAPIAGVSLLNIMNFQWAFITCAVLRIMGSFCFLAVNRIEEKETTTLSLDKSE